MAEKYKSTLREKLKARTDQGETGRTLGYEDMTAETKWGKSKVATPKSGQAVFSSELTARLKQAMQKRAKEVLSSPKKKTGSTKKPSKTEVYKGPTDIRHPAQLIPAVRQGRFLSSFIRSLVEK